MEEKSEKLDLGQIDGAEFEFCGLKVRFELNSRNQTLRIKNKKLATKSKIGDDDDCSDPKLGPLLDWLKSVHEMLFNFSSTLAILTIRIARFALRRVCKSTFLTFVQT